MTPNTSPEENRPNRADKQDREQDRQEYSRSFEISEESLVGASFVPVNLRDALSIDQIRSLQALPVGLKEDRTLVLAVANSQDPDQQQAINFALSGRKFELVQHSEAVIRKALEDPFGQKTLRQAINESAGAAYGPGESMPPGFRPN